MQLLTLLAKDKLEEKAKREPHHPYDHEADTDKGEVHVPLGTAWTLVEHTYTASGESHDADSRAQTNKMGPPGSGWRLR